MEHDTCPFQVKNCGKHCSLYIHEHCSLFIIARELNLLKSIEERLLNVESSIENLK